MAHHQGTARIGDVRWRDGDTRPPGGFAAPAAFGLATGAAPSRDLYWQEQSDRQREPMALLDTAGRVIRTTPARDEALCRRGRAGAALTLHGDHASGASQRLHAAVATDQPALDRAIARAVRTVAPVSAAARCLRRDGGTAGGRAGQHLDAELRGPILRIDAGLGDTRHPEAADFGIERGFVRAARRPASPYDIGHQLAVDAMTAMAPRP